MLITELLQPTKPQPQETDEWSALMEAADLAGKFDADVQSAVEEYKAGKTLPL
jgi:hypothetical protein